MRVARVVGILGVVYVHAWTGLTGPQLDAIRGTWQDDLRWVLMEVFGRSAVPLLGVISGWLVAGSSRIRDWREHIGRKARTILLPMVLWNAIALLLVCSAAVLFDLKAPLPQSAWWVVEELFVLTRNPDINVQMPFLRDLFVCMVAAPILVRAPSPALLGVAALAVLVQIFALGWPVLLRPAILAFFTLGILARRTEMAERVAALPLIVALVPFTLLLAVKIVAETRGAAFLTTPTGAALDLAQRLAAAVALWRLSWVLAASPLRDGVLRIEPCAFLLFCAHLILIWLFGPMIGQLTGPLGSPLYPIYLVLQPVLVLGATLLLAAALTRLAPRAASVLSGGRLRGTPAAPAPRG
ncbi:hypothetical protein WSK_0627 [Novosphingobium sp. Rr 2-17]|nr:hypothetical protein WSK_0627 [Novosphingobium sp. Rr 2-17]